MSRSDADMLLAELYIAEEIAKAAGTSLVGIFDGTTEPHHRRENIRRAIQRYKLERRVLGRRNGTDETFQQFFERKYRQPL